MMSLLKKKPRHEVISIRLSEDRLKLLERYQKVLSEQLKREVSLGEAAFLVIEERVAAMDRETARHEMLSAPTASLHHIRKKWESQHALSAAEWDVLMHYMQIGAEEEAQEPPLLWPAIPSKESYIALLDAFEAVYLNRKNPASQHAWYYVRNLGNDSPGVRTSDEKPEQKHQAVLKQIASRKQLLRPSENWERPGSVARCLLVAIRDEGVDSSILDQALALFWPGLWGLAARGHWLQHGHQPVRPSGPNEDDFRRRIILPEALESDHLRLSFTGIGCPELGMSIDLGPARRVSFLIARYPDLAEFQTMLSGWPMKRSWNGRHFVATTSKVQSGTTITLWLRRNDVGIEFTEREWVALRELSQRTSALPEIQRWLEELRLEYGEQG
ncbi:MAG TPA: hypothetical protein VGI46_00050 [Candidatus Acidoferrum sp.]|jgi:hypothetical protein